MTQESRELVQRIIELQQANDLLQEALRIHKSALADAVTNLQGGDLTAEAIHQGGAPAIRTDLTDALDDFEKARHSVRVSLFAFMGRTQDTPVAEIGRSLGISRQLASRLAQEAKEPEK
jgi:hypothetical protein